MNRSFHYFMSYDRCWYSVIVLILWMATIPMAHSQAVNPTGEDKIYDFGIIPIGKEICHTFIFKNTTSKTLVINKVSTDCSCSKATASTERIAPSQQSEITVVMKQPKTGVADVSIIASTGTTIQDLHVFHLRGKIISPSAETVSEISQITAKEALVLQANSKEVALIDLRPSELYAQVHAQGAQNVPPFALEARQDLKGKTIILINNGIVDSSILHHMDRLSKMGFKDIRFLSGGLRAWQSLGGGVEGSLAAQKSAVVGLLSPDVFYEEQNKLNGWLVISLDKTDVNGSIPTTYPIKNIPADSDLQKFAKKLATTFESDSSVKQVLIASTSGDGYDRIEKVVREAKMDRAIYYLQGGSNAYANYVSRQTQLLTSKKITLKDENVNMTSNRTVGQLVRGAGCSACGH